MRVEGRKLSRVVVAGALVFVLIMASDARASSVTITGGFTSFSGQSGGNTGFPSIPGPSPGCISEYTGIVAGNVVQAASCPLLSNGQKGTNGAASLDFGLPIGSFDFYELDFG